MGQKRKLPSWLLEEVDAATSNLDHGAYAQGQDGDSLDRPPKNVEASSGRNHRAADEDDYLKMSIQNLNENDIKKQKSNGEVSFLTTKGSKEPKEKESKAMKMMEKMGYKQGQSLGQGKGLLMPLEPQSRDKSNRQGIGLPVQSETNMAVTTSSRQLVDEQQTAQEQLEFRDSVRTEHDQRKIEGQIHAAQKICESLDTRTADASASARDSIGSKDFTLNPRDVNVVWRSLVIRRREADRAKTLRQQMLDSSLSFSNREYNEDGPQVPLASVHSTMLRSIVEEDGIDEEDEELASFEQKDAQLRLDHTLEYLRENHHYCFWCGCEYNDKDDLDMNCPGSSEADHD